MNRRAKVVGVWSLQMTASSTLSGLRNIVDSMASRLREVYYVDGIPAPLISIILSLGEEVESFNWSQLRATRNATFPDVIPNLHLESWMI
ncbi:hypothetical protein J3R83DRAFT_2475 [Lanmaoa asiatica]|nr:hypothetical protein J3R83DRAFT_2475 [Lanmaoa asiatica]